MMTESTSVAIEGGGRVSVRRKGNGPDLLLLHSLLTDSDAFDPIVDGLSRKWTVNLVDLPGFGETTLAAPTIESQAGVIAALLQGGGYDPETTAILGNGWGAFVAVGVAVASGSRFRKLILVGCGPAFPEPAKRTFEKMIEAVELGGMKAVVDTAVRRIFPDGYLRDNPGAVEERVRVLGRTSPGAFIAACRALIDLDFTSSLSDVTNSTLVVVGSQDEATPPVMARRLTIPDAILVELDGVGHAPQLQDPVRFLGAIDDFLDLGHEPAWGRS